jgi:hypothetical protein
MHAPRATGATGPDLGSTSEYPGRTSARWLTLGVAGSLLAVYVLLALGRSSLALGASALCASMAIVWAVLFSEPLRAPGGEVPAGSNVGPSTGNLGQDGSGSYLDIHAVEVKAVYLLGDEVFTHLKGGVGSILGPSGLRLGRA